MYRDYFVLDAEGMCWFISTAMARVVDTQLAAHPAPEWITFVDIVGSRVRVRTARVESLAESCQDQRAAYRAFRRAMSRERSSERNWGDE